MSFSSVRIWNVFNFLCFLMRHLPTIVPKMPKKCLIHPPRPSSTVDFLEDDRRLYTRVRPNISRVASRTHVGMYRAARKLQSPAVAATGGEDDLVDGEPVISETEKRRSGRLIREHLIYSFIPLLERAWLPHGGPPLCGPGDEAFREVLSLNAIALVLVF